MNAPALLRLATLAALLATHSLVASARAGVTGVSVTPAKGLSATNFTVKIEGSGQCNIQISTAKDGSDGWVSTLTTNLPPTTLPAVWKYQPPQLLGVTAKAGALTPGKYWVSAKSAVGNGCSTAEHVTSFEVAAPVNLAPLPQCPEGWTLANHNGSGAYTCKPKKLPPAQCPPKHEWFEEGCTAGCRQVAY